MHRMEWESAVRAFGAVRLSRYGETHKSWGRLNAAPVEFTELPAVAASDAAAAPSRKPPPPPDNEPHVPTLSLLMKTVYGDEDTFAEESFPAESASLIPED